MPNYRIHPENHAQNLIFDNQKSFRSLQPYPMQTQNKPVSQLNWISSQVNEMPYYGVLPQQQKGHVLNQVINQQSSSDWISHRMLPFENGVTFRSTDNI